MKFLKRIKHYIIEVLFSKITREIRYRRRLKEMRKRDPFTYH